MNKAVKFLIWTVGVLGVLALLFFFVVGPILKKNTKKHSPEQNITFTQDDLQIDLFYSSPSKKDRVIFGDLVPFGEVWRTGANEASTFTSNKDLVIEGNILPAGTYTLWTIPNEQNWQVIFNEKMYGWGVRWQDSKAMREAAYDKLVTTVNVSESLTPKENFSIQVVEGTDDYLILMFAWDKVVVPVRMKVK
ncbi:MAG: DUF2911 domain-containing protein [Bacteroidota bacterium]